MAPRVDFKHVREHGSFEAVLAAYNIELRKDGSKPGQFKCLCPFHDDNKPSLKVNIERNIYNCFACDAGGNILELVRDMDGLAEDSIRPAALKVAELSGIAPTANGVTPALRAAGRSVANAKPVVSSSPPPLAETPPNEDMDGVPQNRELTFTLQTTLDDELVTWLDSRGIIDDLRSEFALGRASKRSKTIAGRLAIPIHNADGKLVAYCGRYVGDDAPDDEPKYKQPPGFRKDLEIFNLHRAVAKLDMFRTVLVFESYFSVMRHHLHAACISFMGRSVSPQQLELLRDAAANGQIKRAIVVSDGDQPGWDGARTIAGELAPLLWTKVLDLAEGEKPHHFEWDDLSERLRQNW
ncbi:CHC2 zinc finger domain-containing protein [Roseovarius rhodophyticola]|uniref:CHC2 zinc finger domain-containing protein n=1 Tax=Roseovarius rhodophyticola TaxID=3080827 RepID=A0ABZ2TI65_9RHOB|nr:CHC2 zinc finger domain-containing protein [Roseovarius sp. W115]MDV2929715.1 CHC2 zinc finger domain-containing protein [Roseovarius sp. W115]